MDPTRHDQCPEKLSKVPVAGRLIALQVNPRGFRSFTLCLFATLVDPQITARELAQLYGWRWQVELDLRYVKTQLDLHALECKSADMARKLWLAGLMAYNLVRAVMCAAAALSQQSVFGLSFSRSLKALRKWLPKAGKEAALKSWKRLLHRMARFTLPKRKSPRKTSSGLCQILVALGFQPAGAAGISACSCPGLALPEGALTFPSGLLP